ncbi:MAG TPA: AlkA N-terminal domain-containing protein [Candidatus Eremiobacteraceae bacterium]|nr:AlkA N-terminal domain-containing protein [Candidatus Eremiobacteraceae bacterium]
MNLDWQICSRARLSRDPRFDGKFFIGVVGSRVYCRSICPAPTAKEENVRYFATGAAAAEAGFRPCLRCRPECSPGTPAWMGTSNTVSRALRLIGESGLEDGGVEVLAARLGVGSRHLRRLFLKHLGATPTAVARTRRMHFAKKLIDETSLPMTQIALASGFGCVRRFNAGMRKVYHRTPTQIRRLARQKQTQPENQYLFRLRFRPPFDWKGMLAFLLPRAIPGVEAVEGGCYRRSISLNGNYGHFEVSLDEANNALAARVEFGDPRSLFFITERIRAMFDLNADWASIVQNLRTDPVLAARVEAHPGLRVPGCWSGFELAVRAILGQQVTVKGASTLAGRLVKAFGEPFSAAGGIAYVFPPPQVLADANLARIGLPPARAETIRTLARAVGDGRISFEAIVDSADFLARLCEIPGIGQWTAQYVAMRALGEPDAFPSSDLGLLRALDLKNTRELEERAEAWRPWRAYAAIHLWNIAGVSRNSSKALDSTSSSVGVGMVATPA